MATVMLDAGHGDMTAELFMEIDTKKRYTKSCAGSWNDLRK